MIGSTVSTFAKEYKNKITTGRSLK